MNININRWLMMRMYKNFQKIKYRNSLQEAIYTLADEIAMD